MNDDIEVEEMITPPADGGLSCCSITLMRPKSIDFPPTFANGNFCLPEIAAFEDEDSVFKIYL